MGNAALCVRRDREKEAMESLAIIFTNIGCKIRLEIDEITVYTGMGRRFVRYNTREITDAERAVLAPKVVDGERRTYRPTNGEARI